MVMESHGKVMEYHQYVMEFFNRRIIILGVFTINLKEYRLQYLRLMFGFPVYILTFVFDVSDTACYVEVENGAHDHGK